MSQETEEKILTGVSVVPHTPTAEIVAIWFEAVEQLKNHQGLAAEMAKLQAWPEVGLVKPVLPLPESEEEDQLHLYSKFPELATAMDMMVQWDKEQILGIVGKPLAECNSFFNPLISRLGELGVNLYIGQEDEDGRLVALDMGGFYA